MSTYSRAEYTELLRQRNLKMAVLFVNPIKHKVVACKHDTITEYPVKDGLFGGIKLNQFVDIETAIETYRSETK